MSGGPPASANLLGSFIRAQRQMANLSLRQLAALAEVSNPYLSQVERGLSEPSIRVINSIAEALNVSADVLLVQAGLSSDNRPFEPDATTSALRADQRLTDAQRSALLAVYRSYLEANEASSYGTTAATERDSSPRTTPPAS